MHTIDGNPVNLADDCTVVLDTEHFTVFQRNENGEIVTRAVFNVRNDEPVEGANPFDYGYAVIEVNFLRDNICVAEVMPVEEMFTIGDLGFEVIDEHAGNEVTAA